MFYMVVGISLVDWKGIFSKYSFSLHQFSVVISVLRVYSYTA
jgi:hypothetical protein